MIEAPDEIYVCPKCHNHIARGNLVSGNTFFTDSFSDGKISYLMMPEYPRITKCPQCNNIFWIGKLEPIGAKSFNKPNPYNDIERCAFLSLYELITALDNHLYVSKEEEIYLRIRVLWGFNDRVRNEEHLFQNDLDKSLWDKNIYRLLDLLEKNEENKMLIAELHRYQGNFSKCISTLYSSSIKKNDDWIISKSRIVNQCKSKNQMVFMFHFPISRGQWRKKYDTPPIKREKKLKALKPEIQLAISKLFNEGFCLLNGFVNDHTNYLYHFEYVENYRKQTMFKYIALSQADYEKAILIFSQIISIEPKLMLPYEFRGIAKHQLRHYIEAINDYSLAISLNSKSDRLFFLRGFTKAEMGDYYEAIDDYNIAIELNPNNDEAYINRGSANFLLYQLNEAINDYTQAIDFGFSDIRAFYNRGLARLTLNDFKGAIDDFSSALNINNNSKSTFFYRGLAKRRSNDYMGAIADFTRALEIDPDFIDALINRGIAKNELGKNQDAIDDYNKVLLLAPENAFAFSNRGVAKNSMTNFREAILDFDKALDIDPTHGLSYYNRSLAKYKLKEDHEAQIDYNIASGLDPENSNHYHILIFGKEKVIEEEKDKEENDEEEYSYESRKSSQAFLMQCENIRINEAEIRKALGLGNKSEDIIVSDWLNSNSY